MGKSKENGRQLVLIFRDAKKGIKLGSAQQEKVEKGLEIGTLK